jgi:hypothetical protein
MPVGAIEHVAAYESTREHVAAKGSELRGRRSGRPVRLEIHLPPEEIDDGVAERLARTLRRYCDHRVRYNRRETRALRVGGISALRSLFGRGGQGLPGPHLPRLLAGQD